MKPKEIKMTVEADIVFMTNPNVEFVSLVKHGANRMPFKILKSDKGGTSMKGIVQAILISKELPKEKVDELLKDLKSDKVEEFETFKKYVQRGAEDFETDSLEVTKEQEGAYYILGNLKEAVTKEGAVEKEIERASLDDVFMQLYAMADVISGSLRQEGSSMAQRRKTVLTAIDNFRTFTETVFMNTKELSAVKAENHPTLVPSFYIKKEPAPVEPIKKEEAVSEPPPVVEPAVDLEPRIKAIEDSVSALAKGMSELTKISGLLTEQATSLKTMKEEIDGLKAQPVTQKTVIVEPTSTPDKRSVFSGLLYKPPVE